MNDFDVIIVGGGAAGLACAAALSENKGIDVLVLEAGARAGKKLAASGNGQGNIGNEDLSACHYRSGNPDLVKAAALKYPSCYPVLDRVFGAMLYKTGSSGRIFPYGLQASALTDVLLERLKERGVKILLSSPVTAVGRGFKVSCGDKVYKSDYLVLATGGKAQKQFNTDGSAYKLAQSFSHTLTPLRPAIVQLKTRTEYIKSLKGVRAACKVTASYGGNKKTAFGDVVFTDYGVSGNAIFYLSSVLTCGGEISVDFLPDISCEALSSVIARRSREGAEGQALLSGLVHNQIARAVLRRTESSDPQKLSLALKDFTLEVCGTLGFDYAQVTQGGISADELNFNLESKLCKNLYIVGEAVDVDGDCGGYNLYWAFASGVAAADGIASSIKGGKI